LRQPFVDLNTGMISSEWATWLLANYRVTVAEVNSGTTAQRPTKNLTPGLPYFDTSLGAHGKKIFVDKASTGWIDSSGNVV
jgi:hypothetical protein